MNYLKIHESIVQRSKSRDKPECYCELHHIIPKSMGGDDSNENLTYLTAREHFIVHWLLYKIHKNRSMALAFFSMSKPVGNGRTRYTSRSFKYAREAGIKAISDMKTGKNHHMYGLKGLENPNFGSKRSEKTKQKLSEIAKKRDRSKNGMCRKVICLTTGEIFSSLSSAKDKYKKGNISYALKTGGTCSGMQFAYLDENMKPIPFKEKLNGYRSGENSWNSKKVINITTGEVFSTIKFAANSLGVSTPAISYAIKNKVSCKNNRFDFYES